MDANPKLHLGESRCIFERAHFLDKLNKRVGISADTIINEMQSTIFKNSFCKKE